MKGETGTGKKRVQKRDRRLSAKRDHAAGGCDTRRYRLVESDADGRVVWPGAFGYSQAH